MLMMDDMTAGFSCSENKVYRYG